MRLRYSAFALLGLLSLALLSPVHAQVIAPPQLINFQGRLARPDGTPVPNGNYSIRFSLWTAVTAGTEKWNQTVASVAVRNGTFAALLNVSTGAADKFNGDLWLEIKIGTDAALTPRQQLVSVAYAQKAGTVPDGSLTAAKFASGALNNLSWLLAGNSITDPATQFLGTTNNQSLVFRTNNTETMRLLADGKLGLGTSTPGSKMDVVGTDTVGIRYRRTDARDARIQVGDPTKTWSLATGWAVAGDLSIIEEGLSGNRLYIQKATGNVGIGTSTPGAKLSLFGGGLTSAAGSTLPLTSLFGQALNAQGQAQNTVFLNTFLSRSAEGDNWTTAPIVIQRVTDVTPQAMLSFHYDNIGIGTATPGAKLHVNGGIANVGVFAGDLAPFGVSPFETNISTSSTHAWFAENGNRVFSVTGGGAGYFAGNVGIGTATPSTKLHVIGEITATVVSVTGGSDVAEPYEVASAGDVKPIPGYVVAIDPDKVGQMRVAARAYDKTVAGILSGANGVNPGITLRQKGTVADGTLPVASIGRVWCWCDADANGAIEAGDMLTTSNTPGHAMKVSDYNKANGSVIGKAMSSLKSGKGLVLVLVSLK